MTFSDTFHVALVCGCRPVYEPDLRTEARTDATDSQTPDGRLRLR